MTRRLVDCGFIIAVLDRADDGRPMLSLLQPSTDDTEGQTLVIWDTEGLENLREALGEYLDEWADEWQEKQRALLAGSTNQEIASGG